MAEEKVGELAELGAAHEELGYSVAFEEDVVGYFRAVGGIAAWK